MNIFKYIILFSLAFTAPVFGQSLKDVDKQYLRDNEKMINGGFEQGARAWNNSVGNLSVSKANPYKGKNHLRITLTAQTLDLSQVFSIVNETGGSLASCRISTTIPGIYMSSQANGATSISKLISNDGKYNIHTIKDVYPTTSAGIKIYSSAPVTGVVDIDDCSFHDVPPGYIQEIIGTHFVGKLDLQTDCQHNTTSTSYGKILDPDTCVATSTIGALSLPTNPLEAGVKILNPRKDGYYRVEYNGLLHKTGASGYCLFQMSKDGQPSNNGEIYMSNVAGNEGQITANIKFDTGDTGEVFIIGRSSDGVANCRVYGTSSDPGVINVHFYPDAKSHVVTQETTRTAKTENELSASILANANVLSSNYDWIATSTVNGATTYSLTFVDGVFTQMPSCQIIASDRRHKFDYTITPTGATIVFKVIDAGFSSAQTAADYEIHCSKQGVDVNKTAIVQGNFEAINSSELVDIKYYRTTAQSIPSAVNTVVVFNQLERDNSVNEYNTSTGVYTNTKDHTRGYHICGQILFDNILWNNTEVVELQGVATGNNTSTLDRPQVEGTQTIYKSAGGCSDVQVPPGGTITFNLYQNGVTKNLVPLNGYTYMSIKESATTESIIKNLNNDNNFKYQTKFVAGIHTTAGTIGELTFNNLVPGKKYRLHGQMDFGGTALVTVLHNGVTIARPYNSAAGEIIVGFNTLTFTATATTVTFEKTAGGTVWGSAANGSETFATLVQLPNNYVETTEFN